MKVFSLLVSLSFLLTSAEGFSHRYRNAPPLAKQNPKSKSLTHLKSKYPTNLKQSSIAVNYSTKKKDFSVSEIASQWFKAYVGLCKSKPVRTKAITACFCQGIGDALSQYIASSVTRVPFVLDITRTLTFMAVGLCFKGPFFHHWYKTLDDFGDYHRERTGISETKTMSMKLLIDQTFGVLMFYPAYVYAYEIMKAIFNFQVPQIVMITAAVKGSLVSLMLGNYVYWPAVQGLSFRFIPPALRVLFTTLMSVFFGIYVSASVAG